MLFVEKREVVGTGRVLCQWLGWRINIIMAPLKRRAKQQLVGRISHVPR